jgi:hypothetical protein
LRFRRPPTDCGLDEVLKILKVGRAGSLGSLDSLGGIGSSGSIASLDISIILGSLGRGFGNEISEGKLNVIPESDLKNGNFGRFITFFFTGT